MDGKNVLQPEELTLPLLISRNTHEIAGLNARVVSYCHLLLLVDLACIDKFFNGPSPKEPVDENVTILPESISAVHCL